MKGLRAEIGGSDLELSSVERDRDVRLSTGERNL